MSDDIVARLELLLATKGVSQRNDFIPKVRQMSIEEAAEILTQACEKHTDDPNFPNQTRDLVEWLNNSGYLEPHQNGLQNDFDSAAYIKRELNLEDQLKMEEIKIEAILLKYHSPYPEVRTVTDIEDDFNMACETLRAYVLGCVWVAIGTFVNQFFTTRQPSIYLSASLLQLLVYPCGKFWEGFMPNFSIYGFKINNGKWTQKEQMLVTIMFNISLGLPYAISQIFVQRLPMFYNNAWAASYGYQFLLLVSTQLVGFGAAGIMRSILVKPAFCLWPGTLPCLALNRALLVPDKFSECRPLYPRYRFFLVVALISFVYFWLPDYLFEGLSNFSWMSWIRPKNHTLAIVTDMYGLGLNPIPTMDWNILNSNSCLVTPFFSYLNTMIGGLIAGALVIPLLYWSNYMGTQYLPINSNRLFTNTGENFNISQILTNQKFDAAKYQKYSPPLYSAAALVVYGAFFAYYPATLVYTLLYYRRTIYQSMKSFWSRIKREETANDVDAHCLMMEQYPDAPQWWYMIILVLSIILGILCIKLYPTETPVWTIIVAVVLGIVFLIPIGLMESITNTSIGINVLTELIAGYALPGNGTAMMIMKAFGYNTNAQALSFCADLKLGHYAKVPPRATFRAQILAAGLCTAVTIFIANWQIDHYPGICTPNQPQKFTCPGETTYFSASVFWGILGPRRIFGPNGLYPILSYCFLIGVFIPIPFYLIKIWQPHWGVSRGAHPLVMLAGMLNYAPYSIAFQTGGFWISVVTHRIVRRRFKILWDNYNYILSCGLDSGMAIAAILIFFTLQYQGIELGWWGNNRNSSSLSQKPLSDVSKTGKGYFGPERGHYP